MTFGHLALWYACRLLQWSEWSTLASHAALRCRSSRWADGHDADLSARLGKSTPCHHPQLHVRYSIPSFNTCQVQVQFYYSFGPHDSGAEANLGAKNPV